MSPDSLHFTLGLTAAAHSTLPELRTRRDALTPGSQKYLALADELEKLEKEPLQGCDDEIF